MKIGSEHLLWVTVTPNHERSFIILNVFSSEEFYLKWVHQNKFYLKVRQQKEVVRVKTRHVSGSKTLENLKPKQKHEKTRPKTFILQKIRKNIIFHHPIFY